MAVGKYAKSIIAGVTAFGSGYAAATLDGFVSTSEWVSIGVATIIALAAVWAVPNARQSDPPEPK